MKIYAISVLLGRETVERDVVLLQGQVDSWVKAEELKDNFIIIDSYTKREKKHKADDDVESATLIRSILFLRGVEILRKKTHINPIDIENVKQELTTVIHVDGTLSYLPAFPLTTPEVQELTGSEIFTMKCVKDVPQRWVTISVDEKQLGLKEKPQLNEKASKFFGCELYGNVIFVNENLVS